LAESVDEADLDTGILPPNQLSVEEWKILIGIEKRLSDVKKRATLDRDCADAKRSAVPKEFEPHYVARAESRRQRVLLLDGARGTGKTSFLLTLINRWHNAAGLPHTEPWVVEEQTRTKLESEGVIPAEAPSNVRVIRNLDFDPLPPKMPLVAGIVQAWRPLVESYDREIFTLDELCDNAGGQRLMDSWHSLFRVAAAGWSELPRSKGLIEQVLDREEQVRDWQHFREQWLWFVGAVISSGVCSKSPARLKDPPVFVIVIDDVDLQVERIRELLPALRLLVHDNVFFLVAAHHRHMSDMLKYDFLGQQRRLAESPGQDAATLKAIADKDRWASELAYAAFEKVFPVRNRWRLDQLILSDLLQYPNSGSGPLKTFFEVLNQVTGEVSPGSDSAIDKKAKETAGRAIERLAAAAKNAFLTLPALSYRSAHQLWQTVSGMSAGSENTLERAAGVVSRLVSSYADEPARVLPDEKHTVQVPTAGELAAFYRPGASDPGGADNVVVSARPDFLYVSPDGVITVMSEGNARFDFTAGLVAKTLQEQKFAVDASALNWEVRLALAWTDWPTMNAAFAWTWHTHPRPDELLVRTAEWSEYLRGIGGVDEKMNIRERHAYAWIYYEQRSLQRKRPTSPPSSDMPAAPTELADKTEFPWHDLIAAVKDGAENDKPRWMEWLPLLARPKLGLPREVQEMLLKHLENAEDFSSVLRQLRDQRRRLATAAVNVANLRHGKVGNIPTDDAIELMLAKIESGHRDSHKGVSSPWSRLVKDEVPLPSQKVG
jgi:hypothetical protein